MKQLAYQTLEDLLNNYLHMDPASEKRLEELAGKNLKLSIKPITVFFAFKKQKIQLLEDIDNQKIDATLEGYPLAFLQLHFSKKDQIPSLFKQDLTVSGDLDFGQEVRDLFSNLDIDWEEQLSKLTGDIVAHQFANIIKSSITNVEQVSSSLQQSFTEYLQEEIKVLPCKEELEDFFDDIDRLRLRVDRLQAKLDQLL